MNLSAYDAAPVIEQQSQGKSQSASASTSMGQSLLAETARPLAILSGFSSLAFLGGFAGSAYAARAPATDCWICSLLLVLLGGSLLLLGLRLPLRATIAVLALAVHIVLICSATSRHELDLPLARAIPGLALQLQALLPLTLCVSLFAECHERLLQRRTAAARLD